MPLMRWTDQYSVGIGAMDDQHRIIFDIINELFDAIRSGQQGDVLGVINRLVDYTQVHFNEEEEMLKEKNDPTLAWQQREHKIFFTEVDKFKQQAAQGGFLPLEKDLSRFLMTWWNKHILEGDKKYAPKQ